MNNEEQSRLVPESGSNVRPAALRAVPRAWSGRCASSAGDHNDPTDAPGIMRRILIKTVVLALPLLWLGAWGNDAYAANCTSIAATAWNVQTTWGPGGIGCAGAPGGIPGAADTVTIATNVALDAARSITNLTVNLGATLTPNAKTLTISGNITINGTVNDPAAGANGILQSTGNAAVVSGNGGFTGEARIYFSSTGPSIAAGSTLSFAETTQIRAGRNGRVTVAASVLTINGTITSTQAAGTSLLGLYANSTIIGATGVINAAPSTIDYQTNAATLTNNGSVTIQSVVDTNNTNVWTNAANSTLNVSGALMATSGGVLTANAAGNTVNYTGAAQTGKVTTYDNLTLSGSAAKTFATTPTVNNVLSLEGTATVTITVGVVTYGANATLQYKTTNVRTVSAEEWITPFAAAGGVIIANTAGSITLNGAKVFNASVPLTINSGATLITNNLQLTFGGDFINNGGTFTAGSSNINIANTMATQSIDGFTTTGTVSMTKTAGIATLQGNVNGGALTINGAGGTLNLGSGLTHTFTGTWTTTAGTLDGGSSTLNVGGSCSAPPPVATFAAGTGTVNWNAAGAQTVCRYAYNNLTLSNAGAKTMTGVTTIGGNLTVSGTATMTGNAGFTVAGALNYFSTAGTTILTAGTPISIGTFNQSGVGGTLNDNGNTITVTGTGASTWVKTGGTFTATGTVVFTGAAPQIGASNFNNLTINVGSGNMATLTGNVTPSGNLTVSTGTLDLGAFLADHSLPAGNTLTVADGATLKIGGTDTLPINYSAYSLGATSTVDYYGTNQTVSAQSYGNLIMSDSGTVTMPAAPMTVAGDFTNNSTTFNANNGTITLDGAGVQTLGGTSPSTFYDLAVTNASGISLGNDQTVTNVFTLTSGAVTTNGYTLSVTSSCATGISRTSGYVVGNVTLHYPTNAGTTTCTFPIGDASGYTPVAVAMVNVTSSLANSTLTAGTTAGDHADTPACISGVDPTRSVNRTWTLTPGGSLIFNDYSATFTFVNGDIDGGATTGSFIIVRKNGGVWTYPTMGAKNPNDTTATGITQASGFGVFVIGEVAMPSLTIVKLYTLLSDPVNGAVSPIAIPGALVKYTVKVINSGCGPVDKDTITAADAVPANMTMYTQDDGSGVPVTFICSVGPPACGLTGTYPGDVTYKDSGGAPYTPTQPYDPNVKSVSINPKGVLNGTAGTQTEFDINYRMKIN